MMPKGLRTAGCTSRTLISSLLTRRRPRLLSSSDSILSRARITERITRWPTIWKGSHVPTWETRISISSSSQNTRTCMKRPEKKMKNRAKIFTNLWSTYWKIEMLVQATLLLETLWKSTSLIWLRFHKNSKILRWKTISLLRRAREQGAVRESTLGLIGHLLAMMSGGALIGSLSLQLVKRRQSASSWFLQHSSRELLGSQIKPISVLPELETMILRMQTLTCSESMTISRQISTMDSTERTLSIRVRETWRNPTISDLRNGQLSRSFGALTSQSHSVYCARNRLMFVSSRDGSETTWSKLKTTQTLIMISKLLQGLSQS